MHPVQRRNSRPAASRSVFACILAGFTLSIASTCSKAGALPELPLPEEADAGFVAAAQSAVPAEHTSIAVIAAAATPGLVHDMIKPKYPEQARRDRVEGYVVVQFDIARDGMVSDVRVLEAKPANYFETAAIDAVRQLQFTPDTNATDAVAIRGAVNMFVFSLNAPNSQTKPGFIYYRGRTYYTLAD